MVERVIYEKECNGTIIQVIDKPRTRHLRFGNSVKQSSMLKNYPDALALKYIRTMAQGLLLNTNPSRILFLGLGGGSLVNYIDKHFDAHIDVVEVLPDLVDISYKYFGVRKGLNIVVDEAQHYLENTNKQYDFVFVDIFDKCGMPSFVLTDQFLHLLSNSLTDTGWIVWNTWMESKFGKKFSTQLDQYFDMILVRPPLPDSGNIVLFCGKSEVNIDNRKISSIQQRIPKLGIKKDVVFTSQFERL